MISSNFPKEGALYETTRIAVIPMRYDDGRSVGFGYVRLRVRMGQLVLYNHGHSGPKSEKSTICELKSEILLDNFFNK